MNHRRHPQVPNTNQVIPGAPVNIVLKADQPTGRTVQGVVRDVLTRGNHPRGIKVRLADGRVGRVQTMASGSESGSSSTPITTTAATSLSYSSAVPPISVEHYPGLVWGGGMQEAEQGQSYDDSYGRGGRPRRGGRRGGGSGGNASRGYDYEPDLPSQQIGLDAYVKEGKPKRSGKARGASSAAAIDDEDGGQASGHQAPLETATCPVCGTFEGDETAVAHHVAAHFDTDS